MSKLMWLFLGAAVILGCRGKDVDSVGRDAGPMPDSGAFSGVLPATLDCQVSLDRKVSAPMEGVRIEGELPALEDGILRLVTPEGHVSLATIFTDANGDFFQVPIGATDPFEGGSVALQFTDGVEACEAAELEVSALSAEAFDAEAAVNGLIASTTAELEPFGMTLEDAAGRVVPSDERLEVDIEDPAALPWVLSAYLLVGSEYSVRPLLETMEEEDLRVLSALMASSQSRSGATGLVPTTPVDPGAITTVAGCLFAEKRREYDQEGLSETMKECGRPSCNVVRAYGDELLDIANIASSGAGTVGGAAIIAFTTVSVISKFHAAYHCATQPEKLSEIFVTPANLEFEEDFEGEKGIAVEVVARPGPPFNISGRIAQLLLQVASVIGVVGAGEKLLAGAVPKFDGLGVVVDDTLRNFVAMLTSQIATDSGESIDFTASSEPVLARLTSLEYVDLISTTDRSLGVEVDGGLGVRPLKVGEDLINIVPKLEKFPGAVVSTELPVNVQAISVFLDPTIKVVLPGTTHLVKYEVFGALNPALEWLPPMGTGRFETFEATGVVDVTVPAEEAEFPHVVGVTPLSNGGLRGEPNAPSRRVQAIFLLDGLTVGPSLPCVREGESVKLWAAAPAGATITWTGSNLSATSGEEVMFNAPSVGESGETFEIKVLAELGEDRMWAAALDIFVGECACRAFFRSNGPGVAGGSFQYSLTLTRAASASGWEYQAQWSNRFIMMWSGPDRLTDGVYPASLIAAGTPFSTEERAGSLTLKVDENGSFIGHFTGILLDGEDPPNHVLVQADFDAVADFSSADSTSPHCRSKTLHDGWRRQEE